MGKLRLSKNYIRERLRNPSLFREGSFRTVKRGKHRIIVGHLKGHVTTTIQAILHPKTAGHLKKCKTCQRLKRE